MATVASGLRRSLTLAAAVAFAGCGGDGGQNVTFEDTCAFAACGGDPVGSWGFEGACIEGYDGSDSGDCTSPSGTISGTLTISQDGHSLEVLLELRECAFFSESDSSGGGSAQINGTMITLGATDFEFCVDGDELRLRQLTDIEMNEPTTFLLLRAAD